MKDYKIITSKTTWLEKHVIAIVYAEGMTIKQTAKVLQIPVATVKKILWDVTDRLIQ